MHETINKARRPELGMHHAFAALFMMGYAMGSPNVAPKLPPKLERPFASLHRDLNEIGLKTYDSAVGALQRVGELMPANARTSLTGLAAR